MTDKPITFEWIKNLITVLTYIGIVVGLYVNVVTRVSATEKQVEILHETTKAYENIPVSLARIEEQLIAVRKDIQRLEK